MLFALMISVFIYIYMYIYIRVWPYTHLPLCPYAHSPIWPHGHMSTSPYVHHFGPYTQDYVLILYKGISVASCTYVKRKIVIPKCRDAHMQGSTLPLAWAHMPICPYAPCAHVPIIGIPIYRILCYAPYADKDPLCPYANVFRCPWAHMPICSCAHVPTVGIPICKRVSGMPLHTCVFPL